MRFRELGAEQARAQLRTIPGIGEFYSGLIANRAVGFSDALPLDDVKSLQCARHYYKLRRQPSPQQFAKIAEGWKPFRNWSVVLLRRAGYGDGIALIGS